MAKLPVLMSHYTEHRNGGSLNFFAFLKAHYFNGDPHDADYETDMQLPFKTASGALLFHSPLSIPVPAIAIMLSVPVEEIQPDFFPHYTAKVLSVCCTEIFQPPRAA